MLKSFTQSTNIFFYNRQLLLHSNLVANCTQYSCTSAFHSTKTCFNNENLPKLVYFSNPLRNVMTKINLKLLRATWDPEFNEEQFKQGAVRAIIYMTDMVRTGDVRTMQGVTSIRGFQQISKDTMISLSDPRLNLLRFRDTDVKKIQPLKVTFLEQHGTNHLLIDTFCAMLRSASCMAETPNSNVLTDLATIEDSIRKAGHTIIPEAGEARRLILAEIFARFHREYTNGKKPEWDIEFFKVSKESPGIHSIKSILF